MSIRIGVLGAGIIAKTFMEAVPGVPDVEVSVICDADAETARALAEPRKIAWVTDYRQVFQDESVDAVYIALPHHLHEEATIAAAEAGKHILLEKPMSNTLEEADRMLAAQRRAKVKLMVGFTHRFHSEMETAKRLIELGGLGQPTMVVDVITTGGKIPKWFWQKDQAGGGVLHLNGSHSFDRIHWLLGADISEVFTFMDTYGPSRTVEDSIVVALRLNNGAIGTTVHNWVGEFKMPFKCDLDIYGTNGALRIKTWDSLQFYSQHHSWQQKRERDDMFEKEIQEFASAIIEDREPSITGADGRRSLAVVLACYESARTGKTVTPRY